MLKYSTIPQSRHTQSLRLCVNLLCFTSNLFLLRFTAACANSPLSSLSSSPSLGFVLHACKTSALWFVPLFAHGSLWYNPVKASSQQKASTGAKNHHFPANVFGLLHSISSTPQINDNLLIQDNNYAQGLTTYVSGAASQLNCSQIFYYQHQLIHMSSNSKPIHLKSSLTLRGDIYPREFTWMMTQKVVSSKNEDELKNRQVVMMPWLIGIIITLCCFRRDVPFFKWQVLEVLMKNIWHTCVKIRKNYKSNFFFIK